MTTNDSPIMSTAPTGRQAPRSGLTSLRGIILGETMSFWKTNKTTGNYEHENLMVTPYSSTLSDCKVLDICLEESGRPDDADAADAFMLNEETTLWIVQAPYSKNRQQSQQFRPYTFLGKIDFSHAENALMAMYICANPAWQPSYKRSHCIWGHLAAWALEFGHKYVMITGSYDHVIPVLRSCGFRRRHSCGKDFDLCENCAGLPHYGSPNCMVWINAPALEDNCDDSQMPVYTAKAKRIYAHFLQLLQTP